MTHDENVTAVRGCPDNGMRHWIQRDARKQRDACNGKARQAEACIPHTPATHMAWELLAEAHRECAAVWQRLADAVKETPDAG